jgi:hypothetical protein
MRGFVSGIVVVVALQGCGGGDTQRVVTRTTTVTVTTAATPAHSRARGATTLPNEKERIRVPPGIKRESSGGLILAVFQSPTGGIRCEFSAGKNYRASLRCDVETDNPLPPRPTDCEGDWGWSFGMRARGAAQQECVSDSFDSRGSILGYGATYSERGIACTSRSTGMRCLNADGHGFQLSRERQRTF